MQLVIETSAPTEGAPSSLAEAGESLAWGIEVATGIARHISELPRERTGGACGMKCVGCDKPLLAFNAGVSAWKRKPHFYHPKGTRREDCHVVASRMAAVERLVREGAITLPAHGKLGQWVGLSGTQYEAWRNVPEEKVSLSSVSYSDKTRALITLPDGRRFVVMLRGEFSSQGADGPEAGRHGLACLVIEAGPNAGLLSELDPEQLREHITLLPGNMRWTCHWDDDALEQGATMDAQTKARAALDELPAGMDPSTVQGDTPKGRRECLLHKLVREILAEASAIEVPGWRIAIGPDDIGNEPAGAPAHQLALSDVREERGLAKRIPDIQCAATAASPELSVNTPATKRSFAAL